MDWPLDLPARLLLTAGSETAVPWAHFDTAWYVNTYRPPADPTPDALDFYLNEGQRLGHSPNPLFDEQWHRAEYPHIAALVETGEYASAFDAYCRRGCLDRSAHWLFNELHYRDLYRDLTNDVFREAQIANGYHHYLRHGVHEDRLGHLLFDPATYLANFDPADAAAIRSQGAFQHYLMRLEERLPELRTSIYFDPDWYRQRYPEIAQAIEAGIWKSALHHYLCNDTPTEFDPLQSFSESHYLGLDPGLKAVIAERQFRNGYMHFLRFGMQELRPPAPTIDLAWYAAKPEVKAALASGAAPSAFAHWLTVGARSGLPAAAAPTERPDIGQAVILAQHLVEALRPLTGRFNIRFDTADEPAVSIILVVADGAPTAMATIASLRASSSLPLELVVVDTTDDQSMLASTPRLPGAKVLRFDAGIAWSHAAEAGRQFANAPVLLFASPDAAVAPGSIDRALARLNADDSIGAVGGLVLQPHGMIADAGGIVWRDGGTHDYLAGGSPLLPEANFVRTVDFCSPAFLMVRASVIATLDGFDHAIAPGYETVDLCLRIAAAGRRVVYDPSVLVTETRPRTQPVSGCPAFRERHAGALAQRHEASGPAQVFARHAGPPEKRILFLEDTVPLRRLGSGFVRSNDIVRALAGLGAAVTVFPVNGSTHPAEQVFGDMPDTVEVMHTLSLGNLDAFIRARPGYYDHVWVARTHNLQKVAPVFAAVFAQGGPRPSLILDTEAVTPYRDAQLAELRGRAHDPLPALRDLADLAGLCAVTVAVTSEEAVLLERLGVRNVATVGHAIEPRPTPRPYAQRNGLLFVGAIHTRDSPNLDSLDWFVDEVLPLVEEDLGWETRLTIAGYVAPGIDMDRFRNHPRITLRGAMADLEPLYNAHRVFIAPTRYAAGAPYKILEAASRGLPVACTDLLRRQLDWVAEQELAVAETGSSADMAAVILSVYRNQGLWRTMRDNALRRLRRDFGWAEFTRSVAHAVALTATGAAIPPDAPKT